jgi:hypothetical protein
MVLVPVRFVGGHQDAFGCDDGVDQPQRWDVAADRNT